MDAGGRHDATSSGHQGMLDAVSTLFALTPPGRVDELHRLTALAHGFIGVASEQSLVTLAKAISNRDDISPGLVDRVIRSSDRAAAVLIKANCLDEDCIDHIIRDGSLETRKLIAQVHPLTSDQTTRLVATGDGPIIETLLERRGEQVRSPSRASSAAAAPKETTPTAANPVTAEFKAPTDRDIDHGIKVSENAPAARDGDEFVSVPGPQRVGPADSAREFAHLDTAARRAILQRLSQDAPPLDQVDARKMLDPLRHEADLIFLTALEARDSAVLAQAFSRELQLDLELAQQLVDEADGDAYLVLGKAAGISPTAFARMIILSKIGLTGSPRDTFKLVDRFKELPRATALFVIKSMREGELVQAAELRSASHERPAMAARAGALPAPNLANPQQSALRNAV